MFYEVIPEGKVEALTYTSDDSLVPGTIVTVPLSRRVVPGVVVKKVAQPKFKTRTVMKVLYSKPLPKHLIATARFIHEYYLASTGEAIALMLPRGVQKQRRKPKTEQMFGSSPSKDCPNSSFQHRGLEFLSTSYAGAPAEPPLRGEPVGPVRNIRVKNSNRFYDAEKDEIRTSLPIQKTEHSLESGQIRLNSAQKKALEGLQKAPGATKLLFGVTGSGKTNVYVKMALNALEGHKSTILLVPEIALTGQLVRVFKEYFGKRVVMIHSQQTEAERHLAFERILTEEEPLIVVGPRSALFAPLSNLGLIIIDEEHESTYFQENTPKYSAVRVASFMAKRLKIPLVLGSATPTVTDYYLAMQRMAVTKLTEKALAQKRPGIWVVDLTSRDSFLKNRYFSDILLKSIEDNLAHGWQTLIFHNRRGSAPLTICEYCGEELECPNCYLPLTLHADTYEMVCHTCDYREKVPTNCPKCGGAGMVHKGFGTKLLESELTKLFPNARVRRFDADNKKGEGMADVYSEVVEGGVDILVGTQAIAKGLDLPKLATVGVVQADAGLSLPDYVAEERMFQLLTQVIGRVGRGHCEKAEVVIQTFRTDHEIIKYAMREDYPAAADYILKKRRQAGFPPFMFLARLEITLKTEAIVIRKVRETVSRLSADKRLVVSPPCPAFHERTAKGYTWQIIVRGRSRKALIEACDGLDKNFRVTLDPPGLL